jgi:predicted phosphodiesterase
MKEQSSMRIALLADIHGNSVALQAVLDDIQARGGVDGYWVLGDHCAIGYDPIGVLERLRELPNLTAIKGNVDRYATSFDLPPPSLEDAMIDSSKISTLMEVAGNFSWTRGVLDATGWTNWLSDLPFDHRTQLPDGTTVLLLHSQPDTDDDKGLNPSLTDEEVEEILGDVNAGLVCVGHFHMPMRRYFRDMQIVNPGSVSNTFHEDTRSYYAILDAPKSGFDIKFHAVTYDVEKAIQLARQTLNIGNDYNISAMSGEIIPSWKKVWDGQSHMPPIEPEP